jgi:transposase
MIYANIKSEEERKRLYDAMKASRNKNWYRRLQIIALSAEKHTVKELSEMFKICQATIRSYINSYNQGGLDKLAPVKPTGRPPKIANWTKEQWDKVLGQTPDQYRKLNTQSRKWTLERLRLYLEKYHNIDVSIVTVHNSLRKTGVRIAKNRAS